MIDELIYLASPYSDPDPAVQDARFQLATYHAGQLMEKGRLVFSPIAHCHPISKSCDLPGDWKYWERYDRAMLSRSTELIILTLPGWEESKGVKAERKIAREMGLKVSYR